MGIGLSTSSRLFAPLSLAVGRLWADKSTNTPPSARTGSSPRHRGLRLVPPPARATPRSLRVVRVLDNTHPPSCAGRMTISGRMEDVCAELDRMIAAQDQFSPKRQNPQTPT